MATLSPLPTSLTFGRRLHASLLLAFGVLGAALVADVASDVAEGATFLHVAVEIVGALLAFALFGVFVAAFVRLSHERAQLSLGVQHLEEELARFRTRAGDASRELRREIESQMGKWGLTEAEREVAWLIMRGLTFKEIAHHRSTTERTARSQSLAIYQKAGVRSARELTAFFLGGVLGSESSIIPLSVE